uniref:Uncharacterized protein n=1 Tax=Pseudo-nitzschia australis TaxID=44445 RepID=A0A7S4EJY1_9STRA
MQQRVRQQEGNVNAIANANTNTVAPKSPRSVDALLKGHRVRSHNQFIHYCIHTNNNGKQKRNGSSSNNKNKNDAASKPFLPVQTKSHSVSVLSKILPPED